MSMSHGSRPFVTLVRLMVTLAMLVIAGFVAAEREPVWSRDYTVNIWMGEAVSREEARRRALDKARQLASNEFGTAVLTERELSDSVFRERTRVVTAGVASMTVLEESFHVDASGSLVGKFLVRTVVHEDELQRQLAALRTDAARDQRLKTLQRENEVLKERVRTTSVGSGEARSVGHASEALLVSLLRQGSIAAGTEIVFPKGSLLTSAVKADRTSAMWQDVEEAFFTPYRDAAYSVSITGTTMEGEWVRVAFAADWSVDLTLMRARAMGFAATYISLPGAQYQDGMCVDMRNTPTTVQNLLMRDAIWLEVNAGSRVERLMLAGPRDSFWCMANAQLGVRRFDVVLSREEATSAGEVKVRVVRGAGSGPVKATQLRTDLMRTGAGR